MTNTIKFTMGEVSTYKDNQTEAQRRKVEIDKCRSILHAELSALLSQCDALGKAITTGHSSTVNMSGELVRVIAASVDYAATQLATMLKRDGQ